MEGKKVTEYVIQMRLVNGEWIDSIRCGKDDKSAFERFANVRMTYGDEVRLVERVMYDTVLNF